MSTQPTPTESAKPATLPPRAEWIDIARALGMYVIMWLHTRNAPTFIHGAVDGGIGLFFILAGYFMPREVKRCSLRALEQARAWLLWMIIPSLFYIAVGAPWNWQQALGWGVGAYNAPLWFLRNLVIFQLLMSGLMLLRLLPKHALLFAIVLCGLGYLTQWAEHTVIRFDWMMGLALGFALRATKLGSIYNYMKQNYALLLGAALLLILQPKMLELFARHHELHYSIPIAPLRSLGYVALYLLLGIGIASKWAKGAQTLALVGRCTMFIFVSHTLLYGVIIIIENCLLGGFRFDGPWLPAIAMLILTPLCLKLQKRYPQAMKWLGCPAPKESQPTPSPTPPPA